MNDMDTAVIVENLTIAYDDKPVLLDVSFHIPKGKMAAIVGPNGAGKTTLLKAMLGLITPLSGRVWFGGSDQTRTHKRIGYVPQSESVDWDFPATVLDVVLMGRYGHLGWLRRPQKADREIARAMLAKMGMENYAGKQLCELSGGQQQRVFLARALAQEADITIMDEPLKGVDAQTENIIIGHLQAEVRAGKTIVAVHHDLNTAMDYFDWVTLLNSSVVANGPVSAVLNEDNLCKTYQGPVTLIRCATAQGGT